MYVVHKILTELKKQKYCKKLKRLFMKYGSTFKTDRNGKSMNDVIWLTNYMKV